MDPISSDGASRLAPGGAPHLAPQVTSHLIGVISDTHGLLRPEALAALAGVERILHAGDVGSAAVLEQLSSIAPVVAVRGNNDHGAWATHLPLTVVTEVAGHLFYLIHDENDLALDLRAAGFSALVVGHSHKPRCTRDGAVLHFNPGSAGPRRFRLPISIGRLRIEGPRVEGELITLEAD